MNPTNIPHKETLYHTAYSSMYQSFVGIVHAYTDVDGRWLFKAWLPEDREHLIIFRKEELQNFVL